MKFAFLSALFGILLNGAAFLNGALADEMLKPGDTLKDCEECPELVVIPPGNFRMGGLNSGSLSPFREEPIHNVKIGYSFAVGKYEVTFSQWDACASDGGCTNNPTPNDEGWGRGNRPVMRVTWKDAREFVQWLKRITGKNYRLLSEAEWEYMARAGTETVFPWGNKSIRNQARFVTDPKNVPDSTVPVGSYKPNLFGVYDVIGNVWEWVEDCWHSNYKGAPTNGKAWKRSGLSNCNRRVARGRGFYQPANVSRLSYRIHRSIVGVTERSDKYTGFRVARSIP